MANPEHLKILKQGVEVWNRWREDNPNLMPDLQATDFEDFNLSRFDLHGADLKGSSFENTSLRGANLRDAFLVELSLRGADLREVDFGGAEIGGASLTDSDLRGSRFIGTDLWTVTLGGANLELADFGWTALVGIDLSQVRGLGKLVHHGPSAIDTSTLENTSIALLHDDDRRGEIEAFYRAAGVEEHLIEYFRSRVALPIQLYSAFISYSHTDKSFAVRLYDQLQNRRVRCWLDEHDMKPGDRILDVVNDAIRIHDKILLCCSEASLNSWWVKDEIRKAMERERRDGRDIIIPLMVDRYLLDDWKDGLAADLRSRLAADFTGWEHDDAKFEEQFERVVRALRTDELARKRPPEPKR